MERLTAQELLPLHPVEPNGNKQGEEEEFKKGESLIAYQNKWDEGAPGAKTVCIIGYGNYGRAFATRLDAVGIPYMIGSRSPQQYGEDIERVSKITTYADAAAQADIVLLSIPACVYDIVAPNLNHCLKGKIVIDVSNADTKMDECHALRLAALLPSTHVIKAFNTISGWSMENDVYGASRSVFVCGNHAGSRQTVMQLAQDMGFTAIDRGHLRAARVLEKVTLQLFPSWKTASMITLGLLIIEVVYYYVRELLSEPPAKVARNVALYHGNRLLCWMALWLLSLVYLPGCIAGFIQLYRGTKYSRFPAWFDSWMKSRKQLGLFALAFAGMHACMSCLALSGEYVKYMSEVVQIPGTKQYVYFHFNWNAEISLLFAVLAMTLFTVLGITSLPSVNQVMSWKEWDFVQSKLGFVTLFFAFLHVTIYAFKVYDSANFKFWPYGIPPAVFFQPLLPGFVLLMKFLLIMPCVASHLQKIRKGWQRTSQSRDVPEA